MTKKEFVSFLNQKLAVLDDKEKQEIIAEYVQHIEMKVENGLSEEDAIKDFGDLNEFVDEILQAYHVNPKSGMNMNFVYSFLDKLSAFLNKLADSILNLGSSQIIQLILEFILLLIVIAIVKWPLRLLISLFFNMLFFLPYFLQNFLHGLVRFLFEIGYFVVACFVIYTFAKKRIFTEGDKSNSNTKKNNDRVVEPIVSKTKEDTPPRKQTKKQTVVEEKVEIVDMREPEIKTFRRPQEIKDSSGVTKESVSKEKRSGTLEQLVMGIIKFFLIFILVPGAILLILQFVGLGVLLGLLIRGVGSIGLFMIICGTLIITISVVAGLGSFIFKGGSNK